jgi:hypothetical protein
MNLLSINKIANETRREFEAYTYDFKSLKRLYGKYAPEITKIDLFIDRATQLFPTGNCGLASLYLQNKLSSGRIVNGSYKKENHTFLFLEEEILVDITADQFGGPKIYIGKLKYPWKLATNRLP